MQVRLLYIPTSIRSRTTITPFHLLTIADNCGYRIRRVKCDEGRPFCARCEKFGVDCDGYELQPRERTNSPATWRLRSIAPQTSRCQKSYLPTLEIFPFNTVFRDNREYSYFLYFQEEAKIGMAGHFDESLFNQVIIPTCCKSAPCV